MVVQQHRRVLSLYRIAHQSLGAGKRLDNGVSQRLGHILGRPTGHHRHALGVRHDAQRVQAPLARSQVLISQAQHVQGGTQTGHALLNVRFLCAQILVFPGDMLQLLRRSFLIEQWGRMLVANGAQIR